MHDDGEWFTDDGKGASEMTMYVRVPEHDNFGQRAFRDVDGSQQQSTLSNIMEFDHVIEVHANGSVSDDMWIVQAPELNDGELGMPFDANGVKIEWSLVGQSSQMGGGHIMGNGEFIGGRLADGMLATPGYYVAIVCDWDCTHGENGTHVEDCNEDHSEGWAIAYRPVS